MAPSILQVISSTDRRGAETFAVDLRDALLSRGLRTRAVALAPGTSGGLDVPALGARRFQPRGLARLRRLSRQADVVIGHGSSTLPACAVCVGRRRPFVYRNIGDPLAWAGSPARRARVRWELSRTVAVVALWEGFAEVLTEQFGVPAQRIVVIPNGRRAEDYPPVTGERREQARAALGVHGPVLAYLGSLAPEKRVDLAIETAGALVGATLLVAGDGPCRTELEGLAARSAPGRVRFLGSVERPAEVLAAADMLLLTSDTEGQPGVLIEAGLSGLPVVATAVGATPAVVEDGVTGRLAPRGDLQALVRATREVLADPLPLGQAARKRCVDRFSMERVAERWDALLRQLAAPRGRDRAAP